MSEKIDYYLPRSGSMPRPESVEKAKEVLKQESFDAPNVQEVSFNAIEFTSICPKTSQPDYGRVEIKYAPDKKCIESKSLKFYLWAYREEGAYCESLAAQIADHVVYAIDPKRVEVNVFQSARGGIELRTTAIRENK